ncbi:MAG: hypothetical protein ACYTG6_06275 [Planctomycetota bacterium]|jgi:hypothetical protein
MSAPPAAAVRRARGPIVAAVLLALLVVGASVRAALLDATPPPPPPGGLFGSAAAHRAEGTFRRLVEGLLSLQGEDGAFDPYPDDEGQPEVRRTGSHALAAAALARARQVGVQEQVPGLQAALDRALDVLCSRQQPGGGFGSMPRGARNPWPGVDATSGGVLALAIAGRPGDESTLRGAVGALARASTYKLRDGWTRALAAIAFVTLEEEGRGPLITAPVAELVRIDEESDRIDCTDYRLAEAIARRALALAGAYPDRVLSACAAEPQAWSGESSDLQSWWLQAWLAARSEGGAAWFGTMLPSLEEAESSPPKGRIPQGWYADGIAQTACAILCLAEGLRGIPSSP